uniref:inorganic diphosphatase n=1 Tax=Mastigamoeba balamuthi TaxID=108607 RepID=A0A0B4R373_MASBA|nr:inorganic pyrophosphatase [Mastigamoeba balamuthi]
MLLAVRRPLPRCSCSRVLATPAAARLGREELGEFGTLSYRMFFTDPTTRRRLSPWHDVPLYADGCAGHPLFHMVCEMPRGTTHKMEICTSEMHNPIKQDEKKGVPRHVRHLGGVLHHYGALPQTWEDPSQAMHTTGLPGDDDPIDIIDVSQLPAKRGDVYTVKPLGVLGLIDEGETDWKVIAVNTEDPEAPKLDDVSDLEKRRPGIVDAIREWYRVYKVADGKALGRDETMNIVSQSHDHWKALVASAPAADGSNAGIGK